MNAFAGWDFIKSHGSLFAWLGLKSFINLDTETIFWDQILKISFGSGHRAAVTLAYGVWTDEVRPGSNPFDAALSMTPNLQMAVLQALAFRWGLKSL